MVGNQGGIRSAALLNFNIDKRVFVATATAIGIVVDIVRLPIYIFIQAPQIINGLEYIIIAILGVLLGTWMGMKILDILSKDVFRKTVAEIIFILGIFMLFRGVSI